MGKDGNEAIKISPHLHTAARKKIKRGGEGGMMKCLKALLLQGREGPLMSREFVKLTVMC